MLKLPKECSNTFDHALTHINSAYTSALNHDNAQVLHDIGIAEGIIKNLKEISLMAAKYIEQGLKNAS